MAPDILEHGGGLLSIGAAGDIFLNGMDLLMALFHALVAIAPNVFVVSSIGGGQLAQYLPQISQANIKWLVVVSGVLYIINLLFKITERFTYEIEKRT